MRRIAPFLIGLPLLAAASAPVQPAGVSLDTELQQARAEQSAAEAEAAKLERVAAQAQGEAERLRAEQAASAQKVVSDQETLSVQEAVSVPEAAVDQKAAARKPPKIKRKENVLGTRTRRARAKTATMKAVDGEPAANAMAG